MIVFVCVCMYVYVCVCMCVYVCMCMCVYVRPRLLPQGGHCDCVMIVMLGRCCLRFCHAKRDGVIVIVALYTYMNPLFSCMHEFLCRILVCLLARNALQRQQ